MEQALNMELRPCYGCGSSINGYPKSHEYMPCKVCKRNYVDQFKAISDKRLSPSTETIKTIVAGMNKNNTQECKDTKGKAQWNLVNMKDLEGIVRIREFGVEKYNDPENWKRVDPVDYVNAIKRHLSEMDEHGIYSLDDESGMPHIWHIGCNYYFLSHFCRIGKEQNK